MKQDHHFLSVIVPAYHMEKTIGQDIVRIKNVLDQIRYDYELIISVDDMESDNTFSIAANLAKTLKRKIVKVIGYKGHKGKGYTVRFGMAKSVGDIVAFLDAGMDLDPNGISMSLEHFEWYKADIIIGSKRHPASKVVYPWQRQILSRGYQILVYLLFGLNVRDSQVGLKIFKREVLEKVLPRLLVKRFAFDIEILAVANYLGYKRIYEAPVEIKLDFGKSSTLTSRGLARTIFAMLIDTLAVFYRLRILNYYSETNHRKWRFDPDLNFRVNVG